MSGQHRLVRGDCFDVLPTLPAGSVQMVFADLPYAHVDAKGRVRRCTANAWDSPIDLNRLWIELLRIAMPRCAFLFTATLPFGAALIASQSQLFRYDLVWDKNSVGGFLNARQMPLRRHELLLVFYRMCPTYTPIMVPGRPYLPGAKRGKEHIGKNMYGCKAAWHKMHRGSANGMRYPASIIKEARPKNGYGHPTQKPVALLEWLIRTYTAPGDTVLDPTAGVFTTSVAAARTGRRSICIERDARYFDLGVERVRAELRAAPASAASAASG